MSPINCTRPDMTSATMAGPFLPPQAILDLFYGATRGPRGSRSVCLPNQISCFDREAQVINSTTVHKPENQESIQKCPPRLHNLWFVVPLDRWTSVGSVHSLVFDSGCPRSWICKHKRYLLISSTLTRRSKSTPPPTQQNTPSAKPTPRMLNGKVYGRRPFNKTSTIPYYGMGSDRSSASYSVSSA